MRILAIITGEYGQRHVNNIRAHGPDHWQIEVWKAPSVYPLVIDYPEDYLPDDLPPADLVLAFGEHKGVAELIPEVVKMTGARAVIAPVDREGWLPRGLARQLRGWLSEMGVACVTPKPLCSLTETHYNVRRHRIEYDDPLIAKFARHFGRPEFRITVDPETRTITEVEVLRDAFCGSARFVAQGLVGVSADEAEQKAGMLHHHYPCLAGMGKDPDFNDTIMHVSGNFLKERVGEQVQPYKEVVYIVPGQRSED
ncbi:MAG: DUF166 domain-containing protein [Anaerolineae bacterium]